MADDDLTKAINAGRSFRDRHAGVSAKNRAKWERKAATILRRAEDLLHEMMAELSEEHTLTDLGDDVVCTAENLVNGLAKRR